MLKLQRYRPGDAADMSLIEFVGRCVPGTWCLVWAGLMCACARVSSSGSRDCGWAFRSLTLEFTIQRFHNRQGELRPARQASQGLKGMAQLQTPPPKSAAAAGGSA